MSRKVFLKEDDITIAATYLIDKLSEVYVYERMTQCLERSMLAHLKSIVEDMKCISGDPVWYLNFQLTFDEITGSVTLTPVMPPGSDDYYVIIP